jgi:hypothetical protein
MGTGSLSVNGDEIDSTLENWACVSNGAFQFKPLYCTGELALDTILLGVAWINDDF